MGQFFDQFQSGIKIIQQAAFFLNPFSPPSPLAAVRKEERGE